MKRLSTIVGGGALFIVISLVNAQPPAPQQGAAQPPAGNAAGRGGRAGRGGGVGGGGGRVGRFKVYSAEAVERGLPLYNSNCGYCHGDRGKGGKAGPDLIASTITLHDEDGVQLAEFVHGAQHSKTAKVEASEAQMADIAAYLHSRIIYASGRGDIHIDEVLVGNAQAGQQYFNGAGGCTKCHSVTSDLKGIGGKYDPVALQDHVVMPRTGRGGFGRGGGAPNPTAPYAVVTLPSGEKIQGQPVLNTDFYVTLRLADGSTKTWAREKGIPKVDIVDPLQAHVEIMQHLTDTDMHNLTAYLATLK